MTIFLQEITNIKYQVLSSKLASLRIEVLYGKSHIQYTYKWYISYNQVLNGMHRFFFIGSMTFYISHLTSYSVYYFDRGFCYLLLKGAKINLETHLKDS